VNSSDAAYSLLPILLSDITMDLFCKETHCRDQIPHLTRPFCDRSDTLKIPYFFTVKWLFSTFGGIRNKARKGAISLRFFTKACHNDITKQIKQQRGGGIA
jgi:hypothetical protein